jgi:hypothetical protein
MPLSPKTFLLLSITWGSSSTGIIATNAEKIAGLYQKSLAKIIRRAIIR